jgi:transcriptional regulator with XRE-family HTH domain
MNQSAIDILRRLVSNYITTNRLTQQAFCDRTGGAISRQALMKLLQRESRLIDAEALAGYARALDLNVAPLMLQMGILTPVADDGMDSIANTVARLQRILNRLPTEVRPDAVEQLDRFLDNLDSPD